MVQTARRSKTMRCAWLDREHLSSCRPTSFRSTLVSRVLAAVEPLALRAVQALQPCTGDLAGPLCHFGSRWGTCYHARVPAKRRVCSGCLLRRKDLTRFHPSNSQALIKKGIKRIKGEAQARCVCFVAMIPIRQRAALLLFHSPRAAPTPTTTAKD